MSNQDQERRTRFREIIEEIDEQYGEVFRRLAHGNPGEPEHDEMSGEQLRAATDKAIERNSDTFKRLVDS